MKNNITSLESQSPEIVDPMKKVGETGLEHVGGLLKVLGAYWSILEVEWKP